MLVTPSGINLSNYIIIVENGNINVAGNNDLTNVNLIANNGNITLARVRANSIGAIAFGNISQDANSYFSGNNIIANGSGDIVFNSATGQTSADNLAIVSARNLVFNTKGTVRGNFYSGGSFSTNGNSDIYGTVTSLKDITFNGNSTFTYANVLDLTDTTPPAITVRLNSDTGVSNSDKIININTPTISGTGEIGAKIKVTEGTVIVGQTTVGSDGNWQLVTSTLTNGAHSLIATATDLAGNIGTAAPLSLVVDTLVPLLTLTNAIDTTPLKNDTKLIGKIDPTGSGLVGIVYNWDNSSNLLQISPDASGNFNRSIDFTGITNGAHTLTITASDVAGNVLTKTYNVNVALDKDAPLVELKLASDTGTSNSDLLTNDPTILGKVTDASNIIEFRASFDGANYTDIRPQLAADGSFTLSRAQLATIVQGTGFANAKRSLSDGNYTLSLSAKDEFGNITPTTTLAFTLDTTAPTTPNFKNTVSSLSSGKIDLTGQAEVDSIVTLNNGNTNTTVDRSGNFYFDAVGLTVGNNNFAISTSDLAGNKSTSQAINIERIASNPDLVLKWNKILLAAITADRTPPPAAARRLAMLHAAIFDAVNAVTHTYNAYRVDLNASSGTSAEAAVAAAAHRILSELYPQQRATFDAAYNVDLANIPDTPGELDGVRLGREVADAMLTWRRNDGAETIEDEYIADPTAGKWQPTAAGGLAVLPEWGEVAPFALDTGSQFRPVAPPDLTSETYTNDFNQVKALGKIDSTTRTAEQTQIARFWADGLGTYTPSGHWNQIAEEAALSEGNTLIENARLFAALNVSLADAGIAAWDSKYTYEFWRPVTAIQQANTDNNPNTLADTTWQPLIPTPLFPEYVSGHSTFSGAAATILTDAFGSSYQFNASTVNPVLTGITRHFNSFQAAAGEASDSRIYGGIHFKTAGKEGLKLGDNIANYVLANNFRKSPQSARISLALANDTGDTRDRITSIPAIAVSLTSLPANSFQVLGGFVDNFLAYADLTADVSNDGKLLLDTARLSAVNGGSLDDGRYTFNLQIVDSNKNILQTGSLSFTLDRTAPILNLSNLADGANLIVGSALSGTLDGTSSDMASLSYQIDNGAIETIPLEREFTQIDRRLPIEDLTAGAHTLTVTGRDTAGNVTTQTYRVNTDPALPFQLAGYNPANGALDVGSTFRPQIFFSHSVDASTLTADSLYATFDGAKLAARIVPSTDGKWAWLYFQNPLPSSSRIQVTVDGNLIRAANGSSLLDADVDGTPGGKTTFSFDTVSLTPVPGTRLTGIVAWCRSTSQYPRRSTTRC